MPLVPAVCLIVVTLTGVALCFTPLFNLVGYESAAASGVVVGLAAIALTLDALRRGLVPDPTAPARGGSPAADFCWLLPRTVGLALIPLGLLGLNALRVRNCDPGLGGEFWLLIPVCAAIVGQGLAWGAGALARSTALRAALALGVVAVDLGWFVARLVLHPPITGHSLLFGWFAGSIYDEALSVPAHLWWYRFICLGFVAAGVMATELVWRHRAGLGRRAAAWGLVAALAPTLWVTATSESKGIALDRADILEALGGSVQTPHFIIHYDPGTVRGDDLDQLIEDHEFRYHEMQGWLGGDPVAWRGRRIRSVVYPNRSTQTRLMGSRGTLVARPWTHEMHIRWDGYGDNALAHELAHLFTAPFGETWFQVATRGGVLPDIGLLEGIAMAADWPPGELDPHTAAAAMRQLDIAPDLRATFSPTGFWTQPSGKAYTLMGSFVRWLVEVEGIERFRRVYGTGDYAGVYGRDAVTLVGEWETWADALPVTDAQLELARYRYRRSSIFGRTCARTVADFKRRASHARSRRDYAEALDLWRQIRAFTRGTADDDGGREEAGLLARMGRPDEALAILDGLLGRAGKKSLKAANRARVLEDKGDILWRAGQVEPAVAAWSEGLTLGVPDGTRRSMQIKVRGSQSPSPEVRRLARDYLLESDGRRSALYEALAWASLTPNDPVPRYLVGFQLHAAEEPAAAAQTLAGPPGLLPTDHLDEQRRNFLAQDLYTLRRLDEAEATLRTLTTSENRRQRTFAAEYLDRVAWMRGLLAATPAASP